MKNLNFTKKSLFWLREVNPVLHSEQENLPSFFYDKNRPVHIIRIAKR